MPSFHRSSRINILNIIFIIAKPNFETTALVDQKSEVHSFIQFYFEWLQFITLYID